MAQPPSGPPGAPLSSGSMKPSASQGAVAPPKFQLKISFCNGIADGTFFLLNTDFATVGSGKRCDIRLDDSDLPQLVAEIKDNSGAFSIRSLGPPGSLFLDKKTEKNGPLQDGTEIRIGVFTMKAERVSLRGGTVLPTRNTQRTVSPPLEKMTESEERSLEMDTAIYQKLGVSFGSLKGLASKGNKRVALLIALLVFLMALSYYVNSDSPQEPAQKAQQTRPPARGGSTE